MLSSELLGRSLCLGPPCSGVLCTIFSSSHGKEFAAIMAARVVEALLLSLSWGFSVQLLMLVIVLPYALLDKSLSLRTFVIIFSLVKNLCLVMFLGISRGAIFTADGHVAVTRIQVPYSAKFWSANFCIIVV